MGKRLAHGPIEFTADVPSESWLETKLEYVREDGRNEFGVPNYFGPITGHFSRLLNLPVDLLAQAPGERAKQTRMVAAERNEVALEVEVRYFCGGERLAGEFSPDKLLALDRQYAPDVKTEEVEESASLRP